MSAIIGRTCTRCGAEFMLGDEVVPVLRVTRKGQHHTEVDPKFVMGSAAHAHLDCPRHARAERERL
ncbi:hypothetical protein QDA04_gp87 [Microbacterium phage Megan]|uniref:Uncharacterized protein n=1 Tax=Microbacterium phage Megan TaxID=2656551 RepID=A0A649VK70_9CAUD|nr:hypothetical protein QDA04_gp87 [Microbacterium phage Megan]QGJ92757.1 hypothetical protein PBI_MEGAN_87 [Microbacterium phage Megan]